MYKEHKSFAPGAWKIGAFKTLLLRTHNICSNKELVNREVECLQHVFITLIGYSKSVVLQITSKVEAEFSAVSSNIGR